jgi:hypothetical protein
VVVVDKAGQQAPGKAQDIGVGVVGVQAEATKFDQRLLDLVKRA